MDKIILAKAIEDMERFIVSGNKEVATIDIQVFYFRDYYDRFGERTEILTTIILKDGSDWHDLTRELKIDCRGDIDKIKVLLESINFPLKERLERYNK